MRSVPFHSLSLLLPFLILLCCCCFPLITSQLFQMRLFLLHLPHPIWHVHARSVHEVCYPCQLTCIMKVMRDAPSNSDKCTVYSAVLRKQNRFCQITMSLFRSTSRTQLLGSSKSPPLQMSSDKRMQDAGTPESFSSKNVMLSP